MRGRLIVLVLLGVVFVVISAVLARAFTVDGAERSAITSLVDAEAAGDAHGMLSRIHACSVNPACRARVDQDAAALRRPGKVVILELGTSAGFSFGSTVGTARVAWRAGAALPVVQCVRVRRAGNVFSGLRIELLVLSRRIKSDRDCPARY